MSSRHFDIDFAAMSVSVILIGYHGDRWLPACLTSLVQASARRLHLVLVDNAGNSSIDTLPLDRFNTEVIRTSEPLGFAEANNFALAEASRLEPIILFLNQDTISPPGWIDECLRSLDDHPRLGAVSPLIRDYSDSGWDPSFLACLDPSQNLALEASEGDDVVRVNNAPAPALLVRTDVLRESGPFDPIFGSYYEDYDLCRRIRELGYEIGFCREAHIQHYSGSTTTTPERERGRMRQIIRNRIIHELRESGQSRRSQLVRKFALDLPRRLARGLVGTDSSQPLSITLQAYVDVLSLIGRLSSRERDQVAWQEYLDTLNWPECIDTPRVHATSHLQ